MRRRSLALFALLCSACGKGTPSVTSVVCSETRVPALALQVQDAQTLAFAGAGAVAIATSGTYADTAQLATTAPDSTSMLLAYNRTGVFSVTVRKQGYRAWTQDSVTVKPVQGCALPATVHLNAMLQTTF